MGQSALRRPFPVRYVRSPLAHALQVEVEWAEPVAPSDADLVDPINSWGEVARLGGMGGEEIDPARSSLVAEAPQFLGDRRAAFHFSDVHIDPRSLMILENVLHFMHATRKPLSQVSIMTDMLSTFQALEDEFPPLYEPVPFSYRYGATDLRVFVEIEFESDQPAEVLADLTARARVWGALGLACGYAEPGALPSAGYLVLDDIEQYSDMLLLSMQRKSATEFAFDGLVNMLQPIHGRPVPVRELRVL